MAQDVHVPAGKKQGLFLVILKRTFQDVFQGPGHKGQGSAEVMAYVGEEIQFCLCVLFQLAAEVHEFCIEAFGIGVAPVSLARNNYKEDGKENHHPHYDSLGVVLEEEGIQFAAEVLNHSALLCNFLFLHLEHPGVVAVHEGALKEGFPFKRVTAEDAHGKIHHKVSAGRVEVGGCQHSVNYILKAGVREGVNSKEGDVFGVAKGIPCPKGHPVVLAEYGIWPYSIGHDLPHGVKCVFLQPAAIRGCKERYPWIAVQGFHETPVAVIGGR